MNDQYSAADLAQHEQALSLKFNPAVRRRMMMTALPMGFCMAVRPLNAATIKTDDQGLTAGEVMVPTPDGQMPAYRAMPAGSKNAATVLVIEEIFGVHEHIEDICRRLAKLGYYAIAPELFARYGDAGKYTDIQKLLAEVIMKVDDDKTRPDMDAAVAFAKTEGANTDKLGVTGFCYGGRQSWLYAAHNPNVKAACPWYGGLLPGRFPSRVNPIDVADKMRGRVLAFYGAKDAGIPVADVEKMRAALKAAGDTKSEIIVYPEADHGFHADYRPTYHESSSKDAWSKLLAWFKANGVA